MDKLPESLDWNLLRAFLATAETGSLSAAARSLGASQPTLTRQIAALEEALGVTLFERGPRATRLTAPGLALLHHARSIRDGVQQFTLTAAAHAHALDGNVTLTASDAMCTYWLPPILIDIRRQAPGLDIQLTASNLVNDLVRREADIAIRHVRPEQADLTAKLVRETRVHLYAASSYLEAQGRPQIGDDLRDAVLIGLDTQDNLAKLLAGLGLPVTPGNFRFVSNSSAAGWELARQGGGVAFMAREIGDETPGMECVLRDIVAVPLPIWLVAHRELHTNPRIRLVFDLLSERLSGRQS